MIVPKFDYLKICSQTIKSIQDLCFEESIRQTIIFYKQLCGILLLPFLIEKRYNIQTSKAPSVQNSVLY